ncbi:MAG: plasmid pRiA4b ORF-3 family protein [Anaerolineae bacterium]|nr:plasmid pRiA4b ORF-3 family protein [Anaerolineae bacterium]
MDNEAKRFVSKGQCVYCAQTIAKSGMTRHLKACKSRKAAIEAEAPAGRSKPKTLLHLTVTGRYEIDYWMHLEVDASKKLRDLDQFLRDIWLECCGHLSRFTIDGQGYSIYPMEDFDEEDLSARLSDVLQPGMVFEHEYDYGSTTELVLKVMGAREGILKKGWLTIMARNDPPPILCGLCQKKLATVICPVHSYSPEGWLCDDCAPRHEQVCPDFSDEFSLPVVNSPRTGVCGYTGPIHD